MFVTVIYYIYITTGFPFSKSRHMKYFYYLALFLLKLPMFEIYMYGHIITLGITAFVNTTTLENSLFPCWMNYAVVWYSSSSNIIVLEIYYISSFHIFWIESRSRWCFTHTIYNAVCNNIS